MVKAMFEERKNFLTTPKCIFDYQKAWSAIRKDEEPQIEVEQFPTLSQSEQKELAFIDECLKMNHWKVKNARRKFIKATALFILFNSNSMDKMPLINDLTNCDLLVIDDFGADRQSDASRANLLTILDNRYDNMLKTVITTNLPFDELNKIEPRIASRLCEYGINIVLNSDDYRKNLKAMTRGR
jgi:hypothetical protein